MNSFLEVDLSSQIKGSVTTTCDACGKVLGESYPRGYEAMTLSLASGPKDEYGYQPRKYFHCCNEDCLRELLNKRAKKD